MDNIRLNVVGELLIALAMVNDKPAEAKRMRKMLDDLYKESDWKSQELRIMAY